jgi:hypothetical protein
MKILWVLAVTITLAAPTMAAADSSTAAPAPQSLKPVAKPKQKPAAGSDLQNEINTMNANNKRKGDLGAIEANNAQAQGNMAAQLQAESSGKKPSKKTGKSQSPPPPK